jgi:hypothetical protein
VKAVVSSSIIFLPVGAQASDVIRGAASEVHFPSTAIDLFHVGFEAGRAMVMNVVLLWDMSRLGACYTLVSCSADFFL